MNLLRKLWNKILHGKVIEYHWGVIHINPETGEIRVGPEPAIYNSSQIKLDPSGWR